MAELKRRLCWHWDGDSRPEAERLIALLQPIEENCSKFRFVPNLCSIAEC